MNLFDSHAHLSEPSVLTHIDGVMARARIAGVKRILNICTCPSTLKEGLFLEKEFPEIKNAGSTTPHDVEKEGETAFPHFVEAAKAKKLVAIGETGLDYHYEYSNRDLQKQFLIRYLHLAAESNLPVIFHCREAFDDLFSIVDIEYPKTAPAILHCFTGTIHEAEEVLKRGWHLSLSGIVTFKKSEALREVAKLVPLDRLLIETDTPYLAPQSKRGQMNEPAFVSEVAICIAKVKGVSIDVIAATSFDNCRKLSI